MARAGICRSEWELPGTGSCADRGPGTSARLATWMQCVCKQLQMAQQTGESVPALTELCIQATAAADFWQVQRRQMEYLPEHAANRLLELLLLQKRLTAPSQLERFRHCATRLVLCGRCSGLPLGSPEWMAYLAGLSHLRCLGLEQVPRLKDRALGSALQRLQGLQALSVAECSGITAAGLSAVTLLSGLKALDVSGTALRSPCLEVLTALTGLTCLRLGGTEVTDEDLSSHLTSLQLLEVLDAWGSRAGNRTVAALAQLPRLRQLVLAWTHVGARLPLLGPGLHALELSQCALAGDWTDADAAVGMALRELVLHQAVLAPLAVELLEIALRSSASCLQRLDLSGVAHTAQGNSDELLLQLLLALEEAPQLVSLDLSSAAGMQDDLCPLLLGCTAVRSLGLRGVGVSAAGLGVVLPALTRLTALDLSDCSAVADDALPVLARLPALQLLGLGGTSVSWEERSRGGSSDGSSSSSGDAAAWRQLRALDLRHTPLSDAGCVQLAAELAAAAAAATADGAPGAGGLRVLHAGGSSYQRRALGRVGLAALGRLTSLQQLTMQGFQVTGDQLDRCISGLSALQQLHVHDVDPWLLHSGHLTGMSTALTRLTWITRDGWELMNAGSTSSSRTAGAELVPRHGATGSGCSCSCCGRASGEHSPLQEWERQLAGMASSTRRPAAVSPPPPETAAAPAGSSSGRRRSRRSNSGAGGSSNAGDSAARRLLAYDERHRYTRSTLLALRGDDGGGDGGDEMQRHEGLRACIPFELRRV